MLLASIATFMVLAGPQVQTGQALLDESAAKLKDTQSVTLSVAISAMGMNQTMKVKLLRGGYIWATSPQNENILTPEGGWVLVPSTKTYIKVPKESAASQAQSPLPGFEPLFAGSKGLVAAGASEPGKLGAVSTLRVPIKDLPFGGPKEAKQYLHLDPATKLPAGVEMVNDGQTMSMAYSDVNVEAGLTAKDFQWTPLAGWTESKPPTATNYEEGLLKLGSKAPAFQLSARQGGKTSLAAQLKGKKAVLVNFWFYG